LCGVYAIPAEQLVMDPAAVTCEACLQRHRVVTAAIEVMTARVRVTVHR
jgi:hypothetical protein